ncbi:hypothetical protein FNV43_RR22945 [Rhamnella rubrinervis]|uniref:glutamyl-tRNA reductase n=1 Tax=Rhamnella rubrinervis TaxID=2594499 RepID=A0A8K0GSX5_9ROSA|nr:hypothetical protein FNV43_RR22945 [Rhamnella rubrinervis]
MAAAGNGFATSFPCLMAEPATSCSSTASSRSQLRILYGARRIGTLVCQRGPFLNPRCEFASEKLVQTQRDRLDSKALSVSALQLLKTSAPDRYTKEKSSIVVIGLNVYTAPVELREKLNIPEMHWPQAIGELCSLNHIEEAAVLSTCNRIEIYVVALSQHRGVKEVTEWMSKKSGVPVSELCKHRFMRYNEDATQHLFEVASGLDSLVLGRVKFLLKLNKVSFCQFCCCGAGLMKLPKSSYATARVLVIGAGKMGKLVIKHLIAKGCEKIVVVNRSEEKVAAICVEFNNHYVRNPIVLERTCRDVTQVGPEIGHRLFIDISVPRNVEPSVSDLETASVYNVDDLKEVVSSNMEDRLQKAMEAQAIIMEEISKFEAWKDSLETVPTIKKFRAYVERIRASEVEKCLSKMGDDITNKEKGAIYDLSMGIVNKLLQGPMQHLRCDGSNGRDLTEVLENMRAVNRMFDLETEMSVLEEKIRTKVGRARK